MEIILYSGTFTVTICYDLSSNAIRTTRVLSENGKSRAVLLYFILLSLAYKVGHKQLILKIILEKTYHFKPFSLRYFQTIRPIVRKNRF